MAPPDRRPWWRRAVLRSSTLQPLTKLVLIVTIEGMGADGKVRPDRAKVAQGLGINHVQRVNDRWREAVDKGYLTVVHKAAYGHPAEYQAVRPEPATDLETRSVGSPSTDRETRPVVPDPTDRDTRSVGTPENPVSTEDPHRPGTQAGAAHYWPENPVASKEVTPREGSGRDRKDKSAATTSTGKVPGGVSPAPHQDSEGNDQPDQAPHSLSSSPSESWGTVTDVPLPEHETQPHQEEADPNWAAPIRCFHGVDHGGTPDPWAGGLRCPQCTAEHNAALDVLDAAGIVAEVLSDCQEVGAAVVATP